MLTLDPASACEVCAESFGPGHVPAVIPCGHVFCAQCLATIVDKTSPRLTPACPLCRGTFSDKTWRLIRVDLGGSGSGSGWAGPDSDRDDNALKDGFSLPGRGKRADGKRLEDKVAQAAAKKCSFEEVSALHKEVQDWLSHDPHSNKSDPQHASLRLSADLLRAILLNCLAYSESNKIAKNKEMTMQAEIDKLNAELRRQRELLSVKTQEAERLRDELNRLRPNNASPSSTSGPPTPQRTRSTPSTPTRPGTSLGFSSTSSSSSSRSFSGGGSGNDPPPPVPPLPAGVSSSGFTSNIRSPSRTPPASQPTLPPPPPAPSIPYAHLAPSPSPHKMTPPRSSTPAPSSFSSHRRTASAMAVPPPQRPSTAMGSRSTSSSGAHAVWMPSTDASPPTSRAMRYNPPSHLSHSHSHSHSASASARNFRLVQETD